MCQIGSLTFQVQLFLMSVDSFHQQMNRGADTEVTLMSCFNVVDSFISSRVLFIYLFLVWLLVVVRLSASVKSKQVIGKS